MEIVGVHLEKTAKVAPLATDKEIEEIRVAVENAVDRRLVDVTVDFLGDWTALVGRCERSGPR